MTKIVYDLLLALEQCDDTHNRCDYLMEHNEIIYLLEYITNLQQENKQLKLINEEYERLNKENRRGFKITSIKEYDVYELLKYKDNWNKLKHKLIDKFNEIQETFYLDIIQIMEQIEKSDSNE